MTNHRNKGHRPGGHVFDESMILTKGQAQAAADGALEALENGIPLSTIVVQGDHDPRRSSAPTHGFDPNEFAGVPFPAEPEVKHCELTYPGRVDVPAGQPLGPGIDRRYAIVQGCSYDARTHKTTVFVEAQTPLPTEIDETGVFGFARAIAASYNAAMAERSAETHRGGSDD